MTANCSLAIRNPAELIAVVPFVLGYHPHNSVALVGLSGSQVEFAACHDLPPPDVSDADAELLTGVVADAVVRQQSRRVILVGYGPAQRAMPTLLRSAEAVRRRGVEVFDVMRVEDGRWWSYTCPDRECCPPEGTPCLPADSVIAAEATFHGRVALPSRKELVAQVAPVDGLERVEMVQATERARRRFNDLIAGDLPAERYGRIVRRQGQLALRAAEKCYRSGRSLDADEIAWLGVLIVDRSVEDYALDRSVSARQWQVRLWTDVLRRVEPPCVAPAGCLLAFTAWQAGLGALARVAVDRALAEEPRHHLAALLHDVLGFGLPPRMLRKAGRVR
ncbi:DUF4192 domain-containing protein [Actinoplanes sp. NPDC020271]|uniref:DUF4192 domain-containing protein n=1 Tax=Actinoplanes sp. NPDC020271 TaxID=3363896 RepID=UPI00379CB45F